MKKDDAYGAVAAGLCGLVGWYDAAWRPFWYTCGAVLAVWTVVALIHPGRDENG